MISSPAKPQDPVTDGQPATARRTQRGDDLTDVHHIHVLGVCGTGMGTFAGMLRERGYEVTGSDENVYPPMSTSLEAWGVPVIEGYRPENLDPPPDLVVVGNVIRRTNPEATEMRRQGLRHTSFPELFGRLFLADRRPTVVAGTHGKTTTTSLLAWLLTDGDLDPGLLVGGIPLNFPKSYRDGRPPHFIVEGDEYDTAYFDKGPKFLHYRPHDAILTGVEFDHADIFADLDAVKRAFSRFVALLPEDGALVVCGHERDAVEIAASTRATVQTYGFGSDHYWRVHTHSLSPQGIRFSLSKGGALVGEFTSPLFGRHNLLNATAALAMALRAGLSPASLDRSLQRFTGIKKRQELKGVVDDITVIDDFAHHPTAVRETVRAVRQRYPGARLWAIFHPESNTSRRRVFQSDYPEAFRQADIAIIARAHRKQDGLSPAESIDIAAVVADIRAMGISTEGDMPIDAIVDMVVRDARPGDVVLGMSGRDFEGLHDRVLAGLRDRGIRTTRED